MRDDREWAEIRPQNTSTVTEAGQGMLRITLLFGSLAVAIALFLAPMLDGSGGSDLSASAYYGGIDRTATGTVRRSVREYTVRRSVLQNNPGSMCIIHSNGIKSGDC
ncbi:MAG: hypothetical protein WAU86_04135 [Oricola sp.]